MNKLLKLLSVAAVLAAPAFADPFTVNRSSFIAGGTQTGCITALYLDKVFPGVTSSGGVLVIYNSSWTLSAPIITSMTLTQGNIVDFNSTNVKGICYQAVLPANGVNIIYKK